MVFEICAELFETVSVAKKYNVKRVELCSALNLGGLTPNYGLIEQTAAIDGVEIHVMIRPKQGDFVYSNGDLEIMRCDIEASYKAGASGVVFGCLTQDNEVDIEKNQLLVKLAKSFNMEVTFHRAFDFCTDPHRSLEQVIDIGFDRILTSGQEAIAEEGSELISELVKQANGRIQLMAGSGVNERNALQLAKTGVDALHFSAHKEIGDTYRLSMGAQLVTDEQKVKAIIERF